MGISRNGSQKGCNGSSNNKKTGHAPVFFIQIKVNIRIKFVKVQKILAPLQKLCYSMPSKLGLFGRPL